jgi:DNA-binding CsgD family transcriptional regulator
MVEHPLTDFLDKANQKILKDQISRRRNGERKSYELVWSAKDGRKISTLISPEPIFDAEGHFGGSFAVVTDISELKRVEQSLREREKELKIKSFNLKEVNSALRVLLKKRGQDKVEGEEKVLFNVAELVIPYLEKLKSGSDERQKAYIGILESNLKDIVSPLSRSLSSRYLKLTPAEIRVANLIKQGKTTKKIADVFDVSHRTIEDHRKNIRKKLELKNKKTNLRTYLQTFQR